MKTLYIHVGSWKTGTSAIQRMLALNREALRHHDLDYLAFPFERDAVTGLTTGNGEFLARMSCPEDHRAYLGDHDEYLQDLRDAVDASPCTRLVLSSELFFEQSVPGNLQTMLDDTFGDALECRIVCYLRSQDEMVERRYVESVKLGQEARSFSEIKARYIESAANNYHDILQRWVGAFGREHVLVRPYEKSQFKGSNIIEDFLDTLGVEMSPSFEMPGSVNPSVDNRGVEVLRILKKLQLSPSEHHQMMRQISDYLGGREDNREPVYLTFQEREDILASYREQNERVARELMGREDGRLFVAQPRERSMETAELDIEYLTELVLYLFVRSYRNLNYRLDRLGPGSKG